MFISLYAGWGRLGPYVYFLQRTIGWGDPSLLLNYLRAQHHLLWADAPVSVLPFQPARVDFITALFADDGAGRRLVVMGLLILATV